MSGYGIDALAFGAHPDDVELFAGGTVARLVELGHSVGVVDLTRGERASHGTVAERAKEAEAAAEVLGLTFRENLELPDGFVDPTSSAQLARVVDVLRRRRPELVIIRAGFDAHRDHPLGSLGLLTEDFAVITQTIMDVARRHAGGRVVSVLEGGYNPDALSDCVAEHLETLLQAE